MWWLLIFFFGVSTLANDKMTVFPQWEAHGHTLHEVKITGVTVGERDRACNDACKNYTGCTFWARSTTSDDCWLKQKWHDNKNSDDRRSGFVDGWPRWERLFSIFYDVISEMVKLLIVNLGDAIKGLRFRLPNSARAYILSSPNPECLTKNCPPRSDFIAQITNFTFLLHIKEIQLPGVIQGSVINEIQASPEIGFNIDQCKAEMLKLNVHGIGLGLDNALKKTRCLTDMLAGKRHAGFKGQNCRSIVPAHPSTDTDGHSYSHLHVKGIGQDERDVACCKACAEDEKCEVFVTDPTNDDCWLKTISYDSKHRDSNVKGYYNPLNKTDIDGHDIAKYVLNEATQWEADYACAQLCLTEHDYCEAWVSALRDDEECGSEGQPECSKQDCWLKTVTKPKGLVKKGILGINGESIANIFGSMIVKKIINIILKNVCQKDMDKWGYLVNATELDLNVTGFGSFDFQVDEEFFYTFDVHDQDKWENTSFTVTNSSSKFKANDPAVQPLVDMFSEQLHATMLGPLANQVGAPAGYLIAGILAKCAENPGSCSGV